MRAEEHAAGTSLLGLSAEELLDASPDAFFAVDHDWRLLYLNPAAERLLARTADELVGRDLWDEFPEARVSRFATEYHRAMRDGVVVKLTEHYPPLGCWFEVQAVPQRFGLAVHFHDVTAIKEAELRATARARAATGEPGAMSLSGLMHVSALRAVAVPVLGFDRRRRLTFCNAAAEALFGWSADQAIGRAAVDLAPFDATSLETIGIALSEHGAWSGEAVGIASDGRRFPAVVTAAVLRDPDGGAAGTVTTVLDLSVHRSDTAAGWEEELHAEQRGRGWAPRLRAALDEGRFELHAQPIVAVGSGEVLDHELLIRLRGADGVLVAPGSFLPAAERHGLITEIDGWVVEQAVAHAARGMRVHVNLSARSVGDLDVLARLRLALERTDTPPERLTLELTETALLADRGRAGAFARHVQRIGCHVALDDFGAGYNSFARIKDIPADVIKIDRQFVDDLTTNAASASVVRAIVAFADGLRARVVAEGVEDEATHQALVELGVHQAQGWHFGRPAPLEP